MAPLLCVGVDVGPRGSRVTIIDESTCEHGRLVVGGGAEGAAGLAAHTRRLGEQLGIREVRFGIEASSLDGWHLALFLSDAAVAGLGSLDSRIYLFSPVSIRGLRKNRPDLPRNEWGEARAIAERLRSGRLPQPFRSDDAYLPLQRLARNRFFLIKELVHYKGHFLDHLFVKCGESPGAAAPPGEPPAGGASTGVAACLRELYPSHEAIARAPLDELAAVVSRERRGPAPRPAEILRTLESLGDAPFTTPSRPPLDRILLSTLHWIRNLEEQLGCVERSLERAMQGYPSPLLSLPGITPPLAAGILGELGDIRNFPSNDAVAKFAGLTWDTPPPGQDEPAEGAAHRGANLYLRHYLLEAADGIRRCDPEFRAYYERKYRGATQHHHRRALLLTARKLVRVIYALLRYGDPYLGERAPAARVGPQTGL